MSLSAGTRLGPYEILAPIGAGGMGQVYRARDPRMGREVAIKVSGERFTERFSREVHAVAALNHPTICHLYDVGPDYLVMELVEGTTLAERIRQGAIPLEEALKIARQIAAALEAAHEKGITHRDLKPGNVMIKPDGTVKVLDFGLAKFGGTPTAPTEDSPTVSMMATQAGVILGTAAYMSPEQAKGKSVDKRADIWGFGVVFYEMLTGNRLFNGETITELLSSVLKEAPDLSRVPDQVRRLLRACLEKDPHQRLRDIGDVWRLLDDAPAAPARSMSWLGFAGWAIAAAALAALAMLAFVHFHEKPRAVRFEVRMPEKSGASFFKLSPNGELLVVADTATRKLEVRALDSLEFRTLPGTDNARYPFWSPDSGNIGFFAGGKLKRISVHGGPVQTLCDATDGRGGAWNSEGVIVFSPDPNAPLQRVDMSGGVPIAITKLSQDGEDHRFPEFLPDQRHFLYTVHYSDADGIYAGSLQGGPSVRILPDISSAVYVPPGVSAATASGPGYLLFRRETTLMAAFDPARLQITGEVFPVAEEIGVTNAAYGAFSASTNGVLAHSPGGDRPERELVWVDRAGKRLGTVGKSGPITYEALSPDEKTVAYIVTDAGNGHSDVWLYDMNRGSASRFTLGTGRAVSPIWSPDGSRIAYAGSPTNVGKFDILQKPVRGGKEELVQPSAGAQLRLFDWSPDGKTVVYMPEGTVGKTKADLFLVPMEGDHKPSVYLQTPFGEYDGQFSPDGRWMSYTSDESGQEQVNVQPIPPSGAKWQVSTAGGSRARWRRDGKELFYIAVDRKLMAVPVKTTPSFEAGSPQELFPEAPLIGTNTSGQFYYTPSKDGQRFLMDVPGEGVATQPPITVVLNWQAGLKK
jgi:predicted Ser/Thr protein kinase